MAIFKRSTPEDALEALRTRAGKLEARRAAAQVTLDEAKARRQQHLLEADLDADEKQIGRLENDVNSASSRLSGLIEALGALNVQISEAEHQLQIERDIAERKVAAERLTDQVGQFEATLTPMLVAMRAFAGASGALSALSYEAAQVHEYIARVASEVEIASGFIGPDLRAQIGMVADGQRAIPKPTAEIIELPIESVTATATSLGEPTQAVFTLKPVKWRARDGSKVSVSRWEDTQMPERLLARATRHEAVTLDMQDRRRRENKGILNAFTTPPTAYIDLGAELLPPEPLYGARSARMAPAIVILQLER
jgi:hypothetical protein